MMNIILFSEPIEKPSQNYGPFGPWIQRGLLECWERKGNKTICYVAKYVEEQYGYTVSIPWHDVERGDHGIHLTTKTSEEGKQLADAIIRLFGWD